MACDYDTEYKCGDGEHNLLKKILGRLKQLAGLASVGGPDTVTLTVSDIEIGAVEIKDGDTDARARIITACPNLADRGLVVRNIPCGVQEVYAPTTDQGLTSIDDKLFDIVNRFDVQLSTRLSEATFAALIRTTCPSGVDPALAVRNIPCGTQAVSGPFLTDAQLRASPLVISAASLPLPAGAATEVTLASRLSEATFASLIRTTCPSGVDPALAVRNVPCGTQAISAVSLPLPNNAASETELQNVSFILMSGFDATISSRLSEATFASLIRTTCPSGADPALAVRNVPCGTQAISAASLPLPTGAATEVTLASVDFWTSATFFELANNLPVIVARLPSLGFDAVIKTVCPSGADPGLVVRSIPCGTQMVSTKTALSASSPAATSVGVTSAQAVASNAARKGLILINTSSSTISLGFGAAAVLNSGVTLLPGDSFSMNEYSFFTGTINAIALGVGSNLAIQEFTT